MNSLIPRGIRNHNPLNIRLTNTLWTGQCPAEDQTDKSFVQFTSFRYGFRAALKLLHNYIVRYDRKTISAIIYRWAPPTENDTEAYIRLVCRLLNTEPSQPVADVVPSLQPASAVPSPARPESSNYRNIETSKYRNSRSSPPPLPPLPPLQVKPIAPYRAGDGCPVDIVELLITEGVFSLAAAMAVVESTRRVWMDAGRRAEAVQAARMMQAELNRPPFTEDQVNEMFETLDCLANGKSNS